MRRRKVNQKLGWGDALVFNLEWKWKTFHKVNPWAQTRIKCVRAMKTSGEEYFGQRQQQKQRLRHPPTPSARQECAKHVCVTGERYDRSCLSKVGRQEGEIETEAEISRKIDKAIKKGCVC